MIFRADRIEGMGSLRTERGFTLVELLIAMGMLAGVIAAIFALYNMQHRTTVIEEDVVEVQQSMRTALDSISADVMMAGFMLPGGVNPLNAAGTGNGTGLNATDTMMINTASASGAVIRTDADTTAAVVASTPITFAVPSGMQLSNFAVGDVVRILDVGEKSQLANTYFTVSAINAAGPSISLSPAASGAATTFKKGSVIVRTAASAPDTYPNTILYCVGPDAGCAPAVTTCPAGQSCLMRIINGSPNNDSVIATNVQDVQFRYVVDGSAAEADAPADFSAVRGVRVSVTGQTDLTAEMSGGAKTREVTTIVKIRNR